MSASVTTTEASPDDSVTLGAGCVPAVQQPGSPVADQAGCARALPDVPTLDEAGLPGFNLAPWFGVLAPAGIPRDIVARLNTEIVQNINSPEFRKRMDDIGAEPVGNTSEQMAQQIRDDTGRFAELVRKAKVSID